MMEKHNMILKVGISGKRYIKKGEEVIVAKKITRQLDVLLKKYETSEFIGFTSLAIGADTIFAKVVEDTFKQPLHIILPFDRMEYEKDFDEANDLNTLNSVLDRTELIDTIVTKLPLTSEERTEAYFIAGKYMVDNCDEILFVWDELMPEGRGGTAEVIGYHCERKKESDIFYVKTSPVKEDTLNTQIGLEYERANKNALKFRDSYKKVWKSALFLGWLAVLIFSINTAFPAKVPFLRWLAITLEFFLVFVIYVLINWAKKRNFHGKYLRERIKAEKYRILRCYYHSNILIKISSFTVNSDKILADIVQRINDKIIKNNYKSNWYANYTIKCLIEDQKKYHKQKTMDIGSKQSLFERINGIIGLLLFINLLLHFLAESNEFFFHGWDFYGRKFAIFINILLPASYAAIEGVLFFQDWDLIKKYSESAITSLSECIDSLPIEIDAADCRDKQSESINLISSIMLTDNKNWTAVFEDKSVYHWVL
jgi:hypothetical protein